MSACTGVLTGCVPFMEALDFQAAFGVPDIGEWGLPAWLGPVYDVRPCPVCRGPPCQFSDPWSFRNFSEYGLCQTCQDAYESATGVKYAGEYTGNLHGPFDVEPDDLGDHQRVWVRKQLGLLGMCSRLYKELESSANRQTHLTGSATLEHWPHNSGSENVTNHHQPVRLVPAFELGSASATADTSPGLSFCATSASSKPSFG